MKPEAIVIGGGFFGCSIALMLQRRGISVQIIEASDDLLMRASRVNQARVHGGYHYPRSLITAYRSRRNYERFKYSYQEAIVDSFTKLYAVGRYFSKVSAGQFESFMKRIGAPLKEAPTPLRRLFQDGLTEKVWVADECAFDCGLLRERCRKDLEQAGISAMLGTKVTGLVRSGDGLLCQTEDGREIYATMVVNATYSGLNIVGKDSGLPIIPLKHELTEMALVKLPKELANLSVTMMCGPFFSFMPYPSRDLTTLSHVRYTPHTQWYEHEDGSRIDAYERFLQLGKISHAGYMVADAARYIPAMRDAQHVDSLWEVKTLLPQTEVDDGRPILFRREPNMPQLMHVMGGKIDNIFDVEDELDAILQQKF